jgi:hypothetical protein
MPSRIQILRFFRDAEARLRELATRDPKDITAGLLQVADDIAAQANELKRELIAEGFIS